MGQDDRDVRRMAHNPAQLGPSCSSVVNPGYRANDRYAIDEYFVDYGFMGCCEARELFGGEDEDVTVAAEAFLHSVLQVNATTPVRMRDHRQVDVASPFSLAAGDRAACRSAGHRCAGVLRAQPHVRQV